MNTSKGFVHIFLIIAVLVIAVVGIGYYSLTKTPELVTSYSECIAKYGPDSTLIYPPSCSTPDGKTFTETTNEQTDATLNWSLYENSEFGFALKVPSEWVFTEDVRGGFQGSIGGQPRFYWESLNNDSLEIVILNQEEIKEFVDQTSYSQINENYKVNQLTGILSEYVDESVQISTITIEKNEVNNTRHYVLSFTSHNNVQNETPTQLNQILSTFEFIEN